MRQPMGRWVVLAGLVTLLLGLFLGNTGPAHANLATLSLSTGRGRAGSTIALTGAAFAVPRAGSGLAATPVVVHWHGEDGAVLAEAVPDRYGSISATLTIPEVRPGTYVLVASQLTPRRPADAPPEQAPVLFPEPGTPARISFEVTGAGSVAARPPPQPDPVAANSEFDSTVWIVLTAAFGAVAMSLFGGGLIAFIHQSRRSRLTAEARWVPPGWYL